VNFETFGQLMCSLLSSFVIFFVSLDSSRQYLFNGIGDVIIGVSVCLMSIFNFFFSSLHKLQGGEGREEIKKQKKKIFLIVCGR